MDCRLSEGESQTAPSPEFPALDLLPPVPARELFNQRAHAKRTHTTKCNQVTGIITNESTTQATLVELHTEIGRLCEEATLTRNLLMLLNTPRGSMMTNGSKVLNPLL